jgi:hypothetical protein
MSVDKILISHIVAELIVITGVAYYYHKKCSTLQSQINDLNTKLENMNGINYLNSIKKHEQFEAQTIQHINKIYSILNNTNPMYMNNISNINDKQQSDNSIKEHFYPPNINNMNSSIITNQINKQTPNSSTHNKSNISTNPLMNTLSMIGPLTTMFKVVMDPKPPHPDELFNNIDINKELNSRKIVEIEDDVEVNEDELNDELKDELGDLHSSVSTAVNTPVLTPKLSNNVSNVPELNICDNGVCKLNLSMDKINEETVNTNNTNNTIINLQEKSIDNDKKIEIVDTSIQDKSSPLRYISQVPEIKRGRPKKNQ